MMLNILPFKILILIAAIAIPIWFHYRRPRFLPISAPRPSSTACWAEAAMIGIMALLFVSYITFSNGYHYGYAERVPDLMGMYPHTGHLGWVLAGVAAVLTLLSLWPALRGRTLISVCLSVLVLIIYNIVVSYPGEALGRFLAAEALRPKAQIVIRTRILDGEIPAEVWINDVYLGTSPIMMDFYEFKAKVPYWPNQPATSPATTIIKTSYSPKEKRQTTASTWYQIDIPDLPTTARPGNPWSNNRLRKYYVRARIAGQWADATYNSKIGGSVRYGQSGSMFYYEPFLQFENEFKPLRTLLNQARAEDYRVNSDWYTAIDSFNELGRIALINASAQEPEFKDLLDEWIRWRYDLHKITSPGDAWQRLQKICDQVECNQAYWSQSIAGRAVGLLAPSLDPEQLVNFATGMIPHLGVIAFGEELREGRIYQIRSLRAEQNNYRVYPIAQAIWTLHCQLSKAGKKNAPNVIQRRIPNALLQFHPTDDRILGCAAALGGCPELDKYLLRQPYDSKVDIRKDFEHIKFIGPDRVNKWLYLLASLDNATGRKFRQQHQNEIFSMLDHLLDNSSSVYNIEAMPAFLFLDVNQGATCLAARYWPHFVSRYHANKTEEVHSKFLYLARMEPASTKEMYLEAWQNTRADVASLGRGFSALESLSLARRQEIATLLEAHINKDISNVKLRDVSEQNARESLLRRLKEIVSGHNDPPSKRLKQVTRDKKLCRPMTDWLIHEAPNHPVLKLLAESPDADLRRMVLDVVPAHPTPGNRALLGRLLADSDPAIAARARKVRADLDRLVATPPMKLVCVSPDTQPD